MEMTVDQLTTSAAIRVELGAIFVSLELGKVYRRRKGGPEGTMSMY